MTATGHLQVYPEPHALARAAAEGFVERARRGVERAGRFSVALTGGGSPRELYRLLGTEAFSSRIPWEGVHLFWGDERAVPPAHPRSNFGMANELLVARVPIPAANVHRMRGELGARRAAEEYEAELRRHFADEPRFDLVHLGLGGNGHVASLFPFDAARLLERDRWCIPARNPEIHEPRITLTPPVLNSAERVEFLVPDAAKARIARIARSGPWDPLRIPAQLVRPPRGELLWLATEEVVRSMR